MEDPSSSWSGVVSLVVVVEFSSVMVNTGRTEAKPFSGVAPGADVGGRDGGYFGVAIFCRIFRDCEVDTVLNFPS